MKILLTVAYFLFVTNGFTAEQPLSLKVADGGGSGELWRFMSQPQKAAYVIGLFDGIKHFSGKDAHISFEVSYATYEKGLDEFYSDYRNELIPPIVALVAISAGIEGKPQDVTDEFLRQARKLAHDGLEEKHVKERANEKPTDAIRELIDKPKANDPQKTNNPGTK